ncbi:2-oxoglutarate dehydrogenase E1 component [Paraburkholderia caballeronis]|uniref:oxoglutarate dehydrogenase (succinyl-transferring) n=1 Tax=Paraburkholderia caballeronis TaxID=416943 RepID=A0A1H7F0R6_9BURK|nr:2-oxoglutarate dehydrogenase E1 component [Paraburkholderia caballeronis]PXW23905.1 2-oxoglutarate dehydrogenase E1 component [Paraburkholderia caballeronis]PXW99669.1 2-oxoglutarate dehydrogenase E1 component [Paraburkholderia caballeronis]RAJ96623.1 2-oxoglutarate dehydrogenase E1 component [Paraburkholderia caballeronis]SEE78941.1 2-oxoglutarate dehydrogenase E1 component [Paraburkholderia caballeronis]SEK19608.1 2-oxoglutarate dehydrogenase E1 component [Paraburkholderia caballeronis]
MSDLYPEHVAVPGFSFESFTQQPSAVDTTASPMQIARFVEAYRRHGYRVARLDPLGLAPLPVVPELAPRFHGLDSAQLRMPDQAFPAAVTVAELERQLRRVYCGAIGLDCGGIRSEARRRWLFARMEADLFAPPPTLAQRGALLRRLAAAEMWEEHVADRFPHAKRFSLEGCESLIPLLDAAIHEAARRGLHRVFLGMPHRGRLNALVNVMDFPAAKMLACLDPESDEAAALTDLPYHLGGTARTHTPHGDVSVVLAHNPSHLQSVYPVVTGMARAWQDEHPDAGCVPVVVHGDAAFAGQGIVAETLNMTRRPGYTPGGTIHVIVNNQIGFTTPNPMDVCQHAYCTDIARSVDAPVIHVNADHPEDVVRAVAIAFDYRAVHGSDIVIDLLGYRRLGHSEHDIPAVTQPLLQAAIAAHPRVTERYHKAIDALVPLAQVRSAVLREMLERPAGDSAFPVAGIDWPASKPAGQPLSLARLEALTAALTRVPANFELHAFVRDVLAKWQSAVADADHPVDWCQAESLAYATLLEEGHGVRISGMDVGRGTFMHRHAVWHAQSARDGDADHHVPLKHVAERQGAFDIVNSPLTEEAVLGFEYGYSVSSKRRLTIWEAQFGDFVNGAQVFIDQYLAPGEYKWGYQSGLTVLLPHGHEGVGPEHSNGFLGRFLQLCADDNLRVAVPSTSAQWFYLLREQALSAQPKPLVVMSPKSQLYGNGASHSPLHELAGGAFAPVLGDADAPARAVTRAVLCSGKLYYELLKARNDAHDETIALIRVEQLYPFPHDALERALARYPNLAEVVWAQEEDANQGAWRSVRDALESVVADGLRLTSVCRTATPSGAHASVRTHRDEQRRIVGQALGL